MIAISSYLKCIPGNFCFLTCTWNNVSQHFSFNTIWIQENSKTLEGKKNKHAAEQVNTSVRGVENGSLVSILEDAHLSFLTSQQWPLLSLLMFQVRKWPRQEKWFPSRAMLEFLFCIGWLVWIQWFWNHVYSIFSNKFYLLGLCISSALSKSQHTTSS